MIGGLKIASPVHSRHVVDGAFTGPSPRRHGVIAKQVPDRTEWPYRVIHDLVVPDGHCRVECRKVQEKIDVDELLQAEFIGLQEIKRPEAEATQ
jgi:hypothetical protein